MVEGKKVIVTGGAGFIGSNLAEELSTNNDVIIIDDLSTGREQNIADLLKWEKARFIRGSILDLELLQQVFSGAHFVFHQAAIPSVQRTIESPSVSSEVNVNGTLNVLLAARDNGVKKVIYASSSSVYGSTPTIPKHEAMCPNPQSPYAISKLVGEYYCQVFQQVYGLATVCLRYFNIYGPRQDPDSQYAAVIPVFIKNLSEDKPPIIFGDGSQTRDFTFVADVVMANIRAAASNATGFFNIGRGESISINQLARLIADVMGKHIEPIYQTARPGDVKYSLADISMARAMMGYEPKYSLEEGLRETMRGARIAGVRMRRTAPG